MAGIKEILESLTAEDRRLWQQARTEMRRSYMTAHNSVLGIAAWDMTDDAFVDLIDIKLAVLFDKAGRFESTIPLVDENKAKAIEAEIAEAAEHLKRLEERRSGNNNQSTAATRSMQQPWPEKLQNAR